MGTDDQDRDPTVTLVWCHRLERRLPVDEHAACLYCFGRKSDIAPHHREHFCDFDSTKDPTVFGFPPTHGRHLDA